jgi:hypothetical protein
MSTIYAMQQTTSVADEPYEMPNIYGGDPTSTYSLGLGLLTAQDMSSMATQAWDQPNVKIWNLIYLTQLIEDISGCIPEVDGDAMQVSGGAGSFSLGGVA